MKTEKIEMHFRKKTGNEFVKIYENGIAELKFNSRNMLKRLSNVDEFKITAEVPVEDYTPQREKQATAKIFFYPFALAAYPFIMFADWFGKYMKNK
ncbi:MAG: hypothetical protein PHW96_04300 [Candidatus Nanoarchaeia archaeon]|nr:hypothetical protein [Candidatus Nanoarchaeia archaeon]